MRTIPKICPFAGECSPEGSVSRIWAKSTAMWYSKVKDLIDTYLSAFQRKVYERSAESPSPQGAVPSDFDVRNYV